MGKFIRQQLPPRQIQLTVSRVFGHKWDLIESPSRKRIYVDCRRAYCLLMTKYTKWPLARIGLKIKRKHCAVIHFRNTAYNLFDTDIDFKRKIEIMEGMLGVKKVKCPACLQEVVTVKTDNRELANFIKQHNII